MKCTVLFAGLAAVAAAAPSVVVRQTLSGPEIPEERSCTPSGTKYVHESLRNHSVCGCLRSDKFDLISFYPSKGVPVTKGSRLFPLLLAVMEKCLVVTPSSQQVHGVSTVCRLPL